MKETQKKQTRRTASKTRSELKQTSPITKNKKRVSSSHHCTQKVGTSMVCPIDLEKENTPCTSISSKTNSRFIEIIKTARQALRSKLQLILTLQTVKKVPHIVSIYYDPITKRADPFFFELTELESNLTKRTPVLPYEEVRTLFAPYKKLEPLSSITFFIVNTKTKQVATYLVKV